MTLQHKARPRTGAFTKAIIARTLSAIDGTPRSEATISRIIAKRWPGSNTLQINAITRAAVSGSELADFADTAATAEFVSAVRRQEIISRIPGAFDVPMRTLISALGATFSLSEVAESAAIRVHAPSIAPFSLTPVKAAGIAVVSNDVITFAGGERTMSRILTNAAVLGSDSLFLKTTGSGVLAGITPLTYSGGNAVDIIYIVEQLLESLTGIDDYSNVVFVTTPAVAVGLSLLRESTYLVRAFADVTVKGGTLAGLPLLVSAGAPASTLIAIDGANLARNTQDGRFAVDLSSAASLKMSDAPSGDSSVPTEETQVSLYQTESTAVKLVRELGYTMLRSNCVGYVSGFAPASEITTA